MGVPTSEVGYTIATTRRETTKVHKNMWWHWGWGVGEECYEWVSMVVVNALRQSTLHGNLPDHKTDYKDREAWDGGKFRLVTGDAAG